MYQSLTRRLPSCSIGWSTFERVGPDGAQRRFTHMPMLRFATLDEVVAAASFLASADSGFIISVLPVSGGIPGAYTVADT